MLRWWLGKEWILCTYFRLLSSRYGYEDWDININEVLQLNAEECPSVEPEHSALLCWVLDKTTKWHFSSLADLTSAGAVRYCSYILGIDTIAMIIRIQLVISALWSCRVISAVDNAERLQECKISLPAEYSKLIPPVQRVRIIVIKS